MTQFRVFILGAGFSAAAGLPLASELWREVQMRVNALPRNGADYFRRDLDSYIEYRRECDRKALTRDQVDFEDFLGYLDVEHYLRLRGSDTWSADGNEAQVIVKMLIGRILAERTPPADAIPSLYRRFGEALEPGDYVLTLNYDILLERALDAVGKPYR